MRLRLLMDFALRCVRFYPGLNSRAELVTLAPGLRPERRFAPLARDYIQYNRVHASSHAIPFPLIQCWYWGHIHLKFILFEPTLFWGEGGVEGAPRTNYRIINWVDWENFYILKTYFEGLRIFFQDCLWISKSSTGENQIRFRFIKILERQFKVELKNTTLHSLKIVVRNIYIKIIIRW